MARLDHMATRAHDTDIEANIESLRRHVSGTADRAGRDPGEITLVAATKTVPPERIDRAVRAGITSIGENRVQEAAAKIPLVGAGSALTWRFIGSLQTNKARLAVRLFDSIDSIDSLRLAEAVNKAAAEFGKAMPCLIEVNTSDEPSKHGFLPRDLPESVAALLALGHLEVRGLMTIGPLSVVPDLQRRSFRMLFELREKLAPQSGDRAWPVLSMGMSEDYEVAIEEGSTMIRLGRAIFESRR